MITTDRKGYRLYLMRISTMRRRLVQALLGNRCSRCGNRRGLEFVYPQAHRQQWHNWVWRQDFDVILREIAGTALCCMQCAKLVRYEWKTLGYDGGITSMGKSPGFQPGKQGSSPCTAMTFGPVPHGTFGSFDV